MYNPSKLQIWVNWLGGRFLKYEEVKTANLSELETAILKDNRLSPLDRDFHALNVTLKRDNKTYFLRVERPTLYGSVVEFADVDKLTPEEIEDYKSMAQLVAHTLRTTVGDISESTRDKKKRLVPNIRLGRPEDDREPYPLSTIADHLEAYKKIGEVQSAIAHFRDVRRYVCDIAVQDGLPLQIEANK